MDNCEYRKNKRIYFINSKQELKDMVLNINSNPEKYKSNSIEFIDFMKKQTQEFYNNLENLIKQWKKY